MEAGRAYHGEEILLLSEVVACSPVRRRRLQAPCPTHSLQRTRSQSRQPCCSLGFACSCSSNFVALARKDCAIYVRRSERHLETPANWTVHQEVFQTTTILSQTNSSATAEHIGRHWELPVCRLVYSQVRVEVREDREVCALCSLSSTTWGGGGGGLTHFTSCQLLLELTEARLLSCIANSWDRDFFCENPKKWPLKWSCPWSLYLFFGQCHVLKIAHLSLSSVWSSCTALCKGLWSLLVGGDPENFETLNSVLILLIWKIHCREPYIKK